MVKLKARDRLEEINIMATPHLKKMERNQVIKEYQRILNEGEKTDPETIKHDRERLIKQLKGELF